MIPKIIHYCWYGSKPLPDLAQRCIASWKKFMPDCELILWNENNSPMDHPYMQKAYEEKKWANLSNYTRLYALKQMGGWYFDTDVELIKTPNLSKFKESCFLGLESRPNETPFLVNNAVIAAEKNHHFIVQCFDSINERFDGSELANLSSPILTTDELKKIGFNGKPAAIESIRILSYDFFYPSSVFDTYTPNMATKNTICVHYNDGSWIPVWEISNKEILELIKKFNKLKTNHNRYMKGKVTLKEYLKFNIKVLGRFIRIYK